jgi:[ribosomal protein S18]-alanine N-acetyltransferase
MPRSSAIRPTWLHAGESAVSNEIHIRAMTEADVEAVRSIAAGLADAPHWDARAYDASVVRAQAQRGIALVAEDRQHLFAGFVIGGMVPPEAEIESIAVPSAMQRRGIARELLAAFGREAQRLGCSVILLEVRQSNKPGRAFYAASGFAETGRRPAYYANPVEDAVLMSRPAGWP